MSGACCHLSRLREANTQCRQVPSAWCHHRVCGKANHYAKMCRNKPAHYMVDEAVIHTVGSDRKTKAHVTLTINGNADDIVSFLYGHWLVCRHSTI